MNNIIKYLSKKTNIRNIRYKRYDIIKVRKKNKIEVIKNIGMHRKYNVQKYINDNKKESEPIKGNNNKIVKKINICYISVSTIGQKSNL